MGPPWNSSGIGRYLPHALLATVIVVLVPALVVWRLAAGGAIDAFLPLAAIGGLVAGLLIIVGDIAWRARTGATALPFGDLMLWSWVRRMLAARRLEAALEVLDLRGHPSGAQVHPDVQIDALTNLATSLELLDPYTHGHSRRVARYAEMIATTLDLPEDQVSKVRTAATVHDVGKLEVPLEILNKPGRLTDEEFAVIKMHAPRGAEMVHALGDPELTEMVAHHHERLDGGGYPSRLGGTEIPLGARIIAVADTFDALTSTRAYRPAKRQSEALEIIHAEAGTQLDPLVVGAFERCFEDMLGGVLAWPLLIGLPHRLWDQLHGQMQAAGGAVTGKAVALVATTAATGTIAVGGSAPDPRDTSTDDPSIMASAALAQRAEPFGLSSRSGGGGGLSSGRREISGRGGDRRGAASTSGPGKRKEAPARTAGSDAATPSASGDASPAPTNSAGAGSTGSSSDASTPVTDAIPDVATNTVDSVSPHSAGALPKAPSLPPPPETPPVPTDPVDMDSATALVSSTKSGAPSIPGP